MDWTVVILQFLQTTLFTLLTGLLVGGGLGLLFGWLFKLLYKAVPGLRPPFMLFPWRTILLVALVFSCTPILVYILGHDQAFSPVLPSAITFLLLVLFLVSDRLLSHWLPTGLSVKLTSILRTLAVLCAALVLVGSDVDASQSGLLRFTRMEVTKTFNLDSLWIMLGIVTGTGLALDLILGVVQMLFGLSDKRKTEKASDQPVG